MLVLQESNGESEGLRVVIEPVHVEERAFFLSPRRAVPEAITSYRPLILTLQEMPAV